jgi:hypothetical protein
MQMYCFNKLRVGWVNAQKPCRLNKVFVRFGIKISYYRPSIVSIRWFVGVF